MKILLVLCALASSAYADDESNLFGFRIGVGALPIDREHRADEVRRHRRERHDGAPLDEDLREHRRAVAR